MYIYIYIYIYYYLEIYKALVINFSQALFIDLPVNYNEKRYVLRPLWNSDNVKPGCRRWRGREFHNIGPDDEKLRVLILSLVTGTNNEFKSSDLRECGRFKDKFVIHLSIRYCGARLLMHLKTSTQILKMTRFSTVNQCNLCRVGVACSYLKPPTTSFADLFCIDCNMVIPL